MGAFAHLREGFWKVKAPMCRWGERVGMVDEHLKGSLDVLVLLGDLVVVVTAQP